MFEGAAVGEVRRQYPTQDKRAEDIELHAHGTAQQLREDLHAACGRLESAWRVLSDDLWDREGIVAAGARPMHEIVFRRLRETEVHHVDLDVGYAPSQWPEIYVEGELLRRLRGLRDRADPLALLGWLLGRGDAPELSPW